MSNIDKWLVIFLPMVLAMLSGGLIAWYRNLWGIAFALVAIVFTFSASKEALQNVAVRVEWCQSHFYATCALLVSSFLAFVLAAALIGVLRPPRKRTPTPQPP